MNETQNSTSPAGHWPLRGDARNAAADRWHGVTVGNLKFADDGAVFDGRGARIEIHSIDALPGRGDFTLSARICIDSSAAESIGDIASKFDPASRTGFNLSIVDHGGMTCFSANYRNACFAIDAGTQPQWTDCGRVGNAVHICALTAHQGALYAATFETEDNQIGHVYRLAGGQRWEDTGLPCTANCAFALASVGDVLYASSGRYDPRNSSLPDVGNRNEQTRIWRMESDGVWRDCGSPPIADADHHNLGVYRGRLYATPSFTRGLFRYEGDQRWTACAEPYPRFLSLCQWRGHLYGGSNKGLRKLGPPPQREIIFTMLPDADGVYRYDDATDQWTGCGPIETETQMYSFCVHRGALFTGTWPSAKVFRSDSGVGWHDCGRLHPDEKEVMAMCVYNGMMYAGTLPAADIYRFDGEQRWTNVGNVDSTPNVKYRRAWSMAVHDGGLFVGALPSGHVHRMSVGAVASDSHTLSGGWHHVAAVRDSASIALYVDGQMRARNSSAAGLDLNNEVPLTIGFGAHDHFRGKISDLRLYDRALAGEEVARLNRRA